MSELVLHTIEPVFDSASRILMLGSIPSPKSRETGFFYGHPQNRFWRVLAAVLDEPTPQDIPHKRAMLLRRHIALWDVLHACEIHGASDASIKNPQPNDLAGLIAKTQVRAVFATGQKSAALYRKYCAQDTGLPITALPSTSPANAAWSVERLTEAYRQILQYL